MIPMRNEMPTILLVEDEQPVRQMLRSKLKKAGYKVISARNGTEALLMARRYPNKIDLLLTDLRMPQLNGRNLSNRIKSLRPKIQVIYMSANNEPTHDLGYSWRKRWQLIQKPFRTAKLLDMVQETVVA